MSLLYITRENVYIYIYAYMFTRIIQQLMIGKNNTRFLVIHRSTHSSHTSTYTHTHRWLLISFNVVVVAVVLSSRGTFFMFMRNLTYIYIYIDSPPLITTWKPWKESIFLRAYNYLHMSYVIHSHTLFTARTVIKQVLFLFRAFD